MKAVVLARGMGRRMQERDAAATLDDAQRAAAAAGAKCMMPVRDGRPFLDYALSRLADAGVEDVCLVVAPDHAAIRQHYDRRPPTRLHLHYGVQPRPTGTAHAVLAAGSFAGGDPFLVLNGDNLYPVDTLRALAALPEPGLAAFDRRALVAQSGFSEARLAQFAVLDVDAQGQLLRITEKPGPEDPLLADTRAPVSMNLWRLDASVFQACRDVRVSARGEYELPEAIALAIARGTRFAVVRASGPVLDLSRRADVAALSRRLEGEEARP